MAPLALAGGIVLVCLAATPAGVIGGAIFLTASVLLFGTSGVYHRGTWGTRGDAILRRMDHSNIYVFIAATYTPLALILLDGPSRVILLTAHLVRRPRWAVLPPVLAIGAALALHRALPRHGLGRAWLARSLLSCCRPRGLILIMAGGVCYTLGAVVYARKRPNPSPAWFGFHEIFHAGTIAGFVCHYVAISMIILSCSRNVLRLAPSSCARTHPLSTGWPSHHEVTGAGTRSAGRRMPWARR